MKVLRFVFTVIHLFIIALLLGTLLNDYISPQTFPWLNLLSLSFPILMFLNIALCLFWLISYKKRGLFFLLLSFALFKPTQRWVNYSPKVTEKPNFKVVTWNCKVASKGREKIYEYLKNTDADLLLAQEYGKEFNVPQYQYRTTDYEIVALNSKTKIVHQEKLATVGNGNAFFADIEFKGKIIRIVNVYLNPYSFDKTKVKPAEDLDKNKWKLLYILRKLLPIFQIHQEEISDIRTAIDDSPYPVILAGDFNSVPNSYEYYNLGNGLKDAFVEVGRGNSTSFYDYKFPIRIDYIFTSKEIKPINYKVDRSVKLSDHYPVIATFKIN